MTASAAQAFTRPAAADDERALRAIYRSTRAGELEAVGWTAPMIDTFCDLQFDMQQAHYGTAFPNLERQVVVEADGSVIGHVTVDRQPTGHTLVDVAVLPVHRGRGIGTRLLDGVVAAANAADVPIVLTVSKTNPAISLYKRIGFQIESTTDLDHKMRRPAAGKRER